MLQPRHWIRYLRSQISTNYIRADLHYVLGSAKSAETLSERIDWLDALLEWIRLPVSVEKSKKTEVIQSSRIRFLLQILERNETLKLEVANALQAIIAESDLTDFFTESGIQVHYSFLSELTDRIFDLALPKYRNPASFHQTFERIISSQDDIDWLTEIDAQTLNKLFELITIPTPRSNLIRSRLQKSIVSALHILGVKLTSISFDEDVRQRLPGQNQLGSPFFKANHLLSQLTTSPLQKDQADVIRDCLRSAIVQIESVYPLLESSGVSIDLVYKLDSMRAMLSRIQDLIKIFEDLQLYQLKSDDMLKIFLNISQSNLHKTSITAFIGTNINLIARKLVERTSETGEHYIIRNNKEFRSMFISAGGGGFVMVFTTVIKSFIGKLNLPLFVDGFLSGLNYSLSFVFIQLSHMTLATKTPAMTASTLARQLKTMNSIEEQNEFVNQVQNLVRGAVAGILGNLGFVIPGAIIFDLVYFYLSEGSHVYNSQYALEQIKANNPFTSLTLVYAILTGGLLWLSSIVGPWVENWFVYRKYFDLFEESRAIRQFSGQYMQKKLSGFLRKNLSAICTNTFLGFSLAFFGIWGKFFGLPFQVRHVTLSAGSITYSVAGLESPLEHGLVIAGAIFGVLVIGLLNVTVSFTLSLFVAARARNIRLKSFPHILSLITTKFLSKPSSFFLPTSTDKS